MIGRRRAKNDADASSPWASDTIEVVDARAEFDWASIGTSAPSDDDLDLPRRAPARPNKVVGAALAVGLLVIVAAVLWPRGAKSTTNRPTPTRQRPRS